MYNKENEKGMIMLEKNNKIKMNQSVEDLNNYIRVTNPGVWLLIVAMLSIMIGILIWSFFGHIERTIDATVYVEKNEIVCYVNEEDNTNLKKGMIVEYANLKGMIQSKQENKDGVFTYIVSSKNKVKDGYYNATIIIEEISPISFLLD